MVSRPVDPQAAPGELERVRALLNSWLIPNDTRVATDRFGQLARAWRLQGEEARRIRRLRDDLRAVVEGGAAGLDRLNRWIDRLGLRPAVRDGRVVQVHRAGLSGDLVRSVLDAIAAAEWPRLKACPDCRWVFYDRTRNASKRWCVMSGGGPGGRACGTIHKVRAFRERHRD